MLDGAKPPVRLIAEAGPGVRPEDAQRLVEAADLVGRWFESWRDFLQAAFGEVIHVRIAPGGTPSPHVHREAAEIDITLGIAETELRRPVAGLASLLLAMVVEALGDSSVYRDDPPRLATRRTVPRAPARDPGRALIDDVSMLNGDEMVVLVRPPAGVDPPTYRFELDQFLADRLHGVAHGVDGEGDVWTIRL